KPTRRRQLDLFIFVVLILLRRRNKDPCETEGIRHFTLHSTFFTFNLLLHFDSSGANGFRNGRFHVISFENRRHRPLVRTIVNGDVRDKYGSTSEVELGGDKVRELLVSLTLRVERVSSLLRTKHGLVKGNSVAYLLRLHDQLGLVRGEGNRLLNHRSNIFLSHL
ncbi:hypothetical protein HID58_049368, partial [Brassica napus]